MLWVNPSQQWRNTQMLAHSPTVGWVKRIRNVKVRKPVGWDRDSLIGKAEAMHTRKAKQRVHLLLPISTKVFSRLRDSRAPSHMYYLGRQKPSLQTSPFLFSPPPPLYMLNITPYGTGHPFGQLGSAVQAASPPSSLRTPGLLADGVV